MDDVKWKFDNVEIKEVPKLNDREQLIEKIPRSYYIGEWSMLTMSWVKTTTGCE